MESGRPRVEPEANDGHENGLMDSGSSENRAEILIEQDKPGNYGRDMRHGRKK
jgi:hypothetical protein